MNDPLLIVIGAVVVIGFIVMFQRKSRLADQARSSMKTMLDDAYEFNSKADEAEPTPTGKFRVQQMLQSTEGSDNADGKKPLTNPFTKVEDDDD